MQTRLSEELLHSPAGEEADRILRTCVHCGFCNATCPTYQLLGDELDGPRGRIYLIKQMLEGNPPGRSTQIHLDRCLTCRSCETTCPSGVRYGRLLEIGRDHMEQRVQRPWHERAMRRLLLLTLPYRRRVAPWVALGRRFRPLLPRPMRQMLPVRPHNARADEHSAVAPAERRVLLLDGCVQPLLAPEINAVTERVLRRLSIAVLRPSSAGCCGAINLHLSDEPSALDWMRRNIDAWWPYVQQGAEAVVTTASGCGVTVKDYGDLLAHDADYADKARRISAMTRDIAEFLEPESLDALASAPRPSTRLAFHAPCTLQHGQGLSGVGENILRRLGFELTVVPDSHMCCGSAGTYSILQAQLSKQLGDLKVDALQSGEPDLIATANIGCLLEIRKRARVPVCHWIELIDPGPGG